MHQVVNLRAWVRKSGRLVEVALPPLETERKELLPDITALLLVLVAADPAEVRLVRRPQVAKHLLEKLIQTTTPQPAAAALEARAVLRVSREPQAVSTRSLDSATARAAVVKEPRAQAARVARRFVAAAVAAVARERQLAVPVAQAARASCA